MFLQRKLRQNFALAVFLCAYFSFTVAGNVIFMFPGGGSIGRYAIADFSLENFNTAKSAGYITLLLMPFAVVPIIALGFRRIAGKHVRRIALKLPHRLQPIDHISLSLVAYGYVIYAFIEADAIGLFTSGSDVVSMVNARFALNSRVGFGAMAVLKSVLFFLSCYAIVCASIYKTKFWIVSSAANFVLMTGLLVLLNMKWPLLIFYISAALIVISFSPNFPVFRAISTLAVVFTAYIMISFALLKLPLPSTGSSAFNRGINALTENSNVLLATILSRMAQPYPYYYETFSVEGPVCGTLGDRIQRRTNPCQPSNLIYQKMFGPSDPNSLRGTAPQAVHIYGYALGGWMPALIELTLASVAIGVFISIPATTAMLSTLVFLGGLSGYYFSQLPFEAAIIYDHGLLWWALLLLIYCSWRALATRSSAPHNTAATLNAASISAIPTAGPSAANSG